jgi:hypothetical protein
MAHGRRDGTHWVHTANWTSDWKGLYGWQVIDHPPCSSHIMPSDLYLLGPLRKTWLADNF